MPRPTTDSIIPPFLPRQDNHALQTTTWLDHNPQSPNPYNADIAVAFFVIKSKSNLNGGDSFIHRPTSHYTNMKRQQANSLLPAKTTVARDRMWSRYILSRSPYRFAGGIRSTLAAAAVRCKQI